MIKCAKDDGLWFKKRTYTICKCNFVIPWLQKVFNSSAAYCNRRRDPVGKHLLVQLCKKKHNLGECLHYYKCMVFHAITCRHVLKCSFTDHIKSYFICFSCNTFPKNVHSWITLRPLQDTECALKKM